MRERWIVFKETKKRRSITFFTGMYKNPFNNYWVHSTWCANIKKAVTFKSFKEADAQRKKIYASGSVIKVDLHPEDRYGI